MQDSMQGDPTIVLKTTQLALAAASVIVAWIVSLLVASWRVSKWVNGVGARVEALERNDVASGTLLGRLEMDALKWQADREQLHDRLSRVEKAIDTVEATHRQDTDKVLAAIGDVRLQVVRVETILEERERKS